MATPGLRWSQAERSQQLSVPSPAPPSLKVIIDQYPHNPVTALSHLSGLGRRVSNWTAAGRGGSRWRGRTGGGARLDPNRLDSTASVQRRRVQVEVHPVGPEGR